ESQLGRKGGYLDALKITATVLSEGPERDTMIVKTKGTAADVDIPYAGSARREGTGRPRVDYQRRRESADRRKGRERRRLESDIVDAKTRIGAADGGHNRCVTAAAGPVAVRQADRDGRWRNGKQAERIDHRLCFPGHGTQQSNGTSFHGGTVDDRWRRANGAWSSLASERMPWVTVVCAPSTETRVACESTQPDSLRKLRYGGSTPSTHPGARKNFLRMCI